MFFRSYSTCHAQEITVSEQDSKNVKFVRENGINIDGLPLNIVLEQLFFNIYPEFKNDLRLYDELYKAISRSLTDLSSEAENNKKYCRLTKIQISVRCNYHTYTMIIYMDPDLKYIDGMLYDCLTCKGKFGNVTPIKECSEIKVELEKYLRKPIELTKDHPLYDGVQTLIQNSMPSDDSFPGISLKKIVQVMPGFFQVTISQDQQNECTQNQLKSLRMHLEKIRNFEFYNNDVYMTRTSEGEITFSIYAHPSHIMSLSGKCTAEVTKDLEDRHNILDHQEAWVTINRIYNKPT